MRAVRNCHGSSSAGQSVRASDVCHCVRVRRSGQVLSQELSTINEAMKLAAVRAIAAIAKEPVPEEVNEAYDSRNLSFGRDFIIPKTVIQSNGQFFRRFPTQIVIGNVQR